MANYPFVMLPAKLFEEDLSGSDFKVIGILARHTNADRICHVFVRTIEKETGISRKSVFRSLNKLEELDVVLRKASGTKEIYHFYLNKPFYDNNQNLCYGIQISSTEDIIMMI